MLRFCKLLSSCVLIIQRSSDILLTSPVVQSFHSRNGKAYLFNSVVNTWPGKQEERTMTTGRHVVEDLHCVYCMQLVGWTYVRPVVCCAYAYITSGTCKIICSSHAACLALLQALVTFCGVTSVTTATRPFQALAQSSGQPQHCLDCMSTGPSVAVPGHNLAWVLLR